MIGKFVGLKENNLLFISILVSLIIVIAGVLANFYATTSHITIISSFLIVIIIFSNYLYGRNFLINPLSIFSIMYMGYAIGAYYYAFSDGDFGKFVSYLNLSRHEAENLLIYALCYALICYIFFVLGFSCFYKKNRIISPNFKMEFGVLKYYKIICSFLIFIGLSYWVWMSYALAGGVIQMLLYFQAFRHIIEEAQLSTLPYHLYYAGIFFWLIASTTIHNKVSLYFVFFSFLGLIIGLSTGRITLAFTYIMAQLLFYYFCFPTKRRKVIFVLSILMSSGFVIYFLRLLSNQYFMGVDLDISDKSFFSTIIGDGNITDLQQLIIIFKTFDSSNVLLGSSYFDTFRNTIGSQLGLQPQSIGLLIKEIYIPSTSGAPTPGAIGEAYANFLFCGPIVMFFVGSFLSYIYARMSNIKNPLFIMIYAIFLARFVFMYPKVDSTMMINFAWGAIPLIIIWFLLKFNLKLLRN